MSMITKVSSFVKKIIFPRTWLNKGRVRKYVEDNHIPIGDMRQMFDEFQGTEAYKVIELAMRDFNDFIDYKFVTTKADAPGYEKIMASLQAKRAYLSWFQQLVIDLKGLEESSEDGGLNDLGNPEKYI